ncbi:MAG: sarcosine oxidase subunit delta [Hyphomicrobiaceae bacterium]
MLLIDCPYCGERPEIEFQCGGEAHIARPLVPAELDDRQWAEFLFYRANTKGVMAERWNHQSGCQRWFNALRNTVSDRILTTYRMGEPMPAIEESEQMRATGSEPLPEKTDEVRQ